MPTVGVPTYIKQLFSDLKGENQQENIRFSLYISSNDEDPQLQAAVPNNNTKHIFFSKTQRSLGEIIC